jgi:antitoxin FitA
MTATGLRSRDPNRRHFACVGAKMALASTRMPSIQIKGVPPEVHRVLRRRAADAGKSLQEYLLALLDEHARRPTLEEVLRRAGERAGGSVSLADAAKGLRAERRSR